MSKTIVYSDEVKSNEAINIGAQTETCPPGWLALEHATFISDNPFRIAGDGSSITQQQLRQKAKGIETRAKAGIVEPSPLDEECGSQNLKEFAMFVQVLANAPERRTAYRIFWPLSATLIMSLSTVKPFRTAGEAPEELNQLYFLKSWLAFLRNPKGVSAQDTLMRWRNLLSDEKFRQRLSQMIEREDDFETDRALKILVQAQKLVTKQLLQQMVRSATTEWEVNQSKNAIEILGAVSTSQMDEDVIVSAVSPFIPIGESLEARVQELISEITPYKIGDSLETPDEVQRLEGLATALKQWHPLTGVWIETIDNWHEIFGWSMRSGALELNEKDDNRGALKITELGLLHLKNDEVKAKLREDASALRKILRNRATSQRRSANHATVAPVSSPTSAPVSSPALSVSDKFIPIFWFVAFMIVVLIISQSGPKTDPSSSASGTSSQPLVSSPSPEASTEDTPSQSANAAPVQENPAITPPQSDTVDRTTERDRLRAKLNDLKTEIDQRKTNIEAANENLDIDSSKIEDERNSLESLKSQLTIQPTSTSQEEVDRYNAIVDKYEDEIKDFNKHVNQHNARLEEVHNRIQQYKRKIDEYNEIVNKLNADR